MKSFSMYFQKSRIFRVPSGTKTVWGVALGSW
jgi:hypothetical protein